MSKESKEVELDEMTAALIDTGEADGNANAEETESSESIEDTAVATADAESESDEEVEVVSEAVVSLSLSFGDEVIAMDVTEDFHVDFSALCNEIGMRPDAFEYEGALPVAARQTLIKTCK